MLSHSTHAIARSLLLGALGLVLTASGASAASLALTVSQNSLCFTGDVNDDISSPVAYDPGHESCYDGGVNDLGVLAALDRELAAIDNREGLDDAIETVGDMFANGLIDVTKRDELLNRLNRMESRLVDDSDEDDHEQSEFLVGGDDCEASDQADEARATGDVRVWDVIDADREGGLCVNDPAVLAAFDAEIAEIDEPGDLADVRDDVVTVFADGYIDAAKRDELLDRLADVKSGLRGKLDTADPDEDANLETDTHTADNSEPETDTEDDTQTTQAAPESDCWPLCFPEPPSDPGGKAGQVDAGNREPDKVALTEGIGGPSGLLNGSSKINDPPAPATAVFNPGLIMSLMGPPLGQATEVPVERRPWPSPAFAG